MLRLTLITLISLYLVLVLMGRGDAPVGVPPTADKIAQASRAEVAPAALVEAEKLVVPAVAEATPAPSVTPVRQAPMPGPALRPSPEYRSTEAPAPVAGGTLWVVEASSANVRSGPSTGNGVVERVSRGEEVLVVADPGNGWVNIRIEGDGVNGWVSKKLLRPAR